MASTSAPQSLQRRFESLLAATLETWAHQLLYATRVYPRETFCKSKFLGVSCMTNRHPDVVSYIAESVAVAVPSLLQSVATRISLAITVQAETEHDTLVDEVLENYTLEMFNVDQNEWRQYEDSATTELMHELERSMRDLVLSVMSQEASSSRASNDSVSFLIDLHIPTENKACNELNQALDQGTWYCPDQQATGGNETGNNHPANSAPAKRKLIVRPLHRVSTRSCTIDFSMYKTKDDRKAPPPGL